MTNIATVSDEELQHTREIYADLVAEGRELDPASELDRMHARGIFPFALELIDEVLRQRKWAREMVEMAASGGRLDGYRELADKLAAKDAEIECLEAASWQLRKMISRVEAERDELRRQLAEAEQDARRYRWLRGHVDGDNWYLYYDDCGRYLLQGDALDAAIDAAMGASNE